MRFTSGFMSGFLCGKIPCGLMARPTRFLIFYGRSRFPVAPKAIREPGRRFVANAIAFSALRRSFQRNSALKRSPVAFGALRSPSLPKKGVAVAQKALTNGCICHSRRNTVRTNRECCLPTGKRYGQMSNATTLNKTVRAGMFGKRRLGSDKKEFYPSSLQQRSRLPLRRRRRQRGRSSERKPNRSSDNKAKKAALHPPLRGSGRLLACPCCPLLMRYGSYFTLSFCISQAGRVPRGL